MVRQEVNLIRESTPLSQAPSVSLQIAMQLVKGNFNPECSEKLAVCPDPYSSYLTDYLGNVL